MTQEKAFLQAIIENPDDDAPRLIYADWLDENGQSEGLFLSAAPEGAGIGRFRQLDECSLL
jgi:uncharacterized protein (TIGR02996 family)